MEQIRLVVDNATTGAFAPGPIWKVSEVQARALADCVEPEAIVQ